MTKMMNAFLSFFYVHLCVSLEECLPTVIVYVMIIYYF